MTILEKLALGEHTVVFKKVNGDIRTLKGTLDRDLVELYTTFVEQKDESDVYRIFDLENKNWRAFRLENLISVDGIPV